jgi:Protein of unknown function (DUF2795)
MSEQISGTHGPAEDDAIKRQDHGELQEQREEWPLSADDDDTGAAEATWAPEARFAGTAPAADWQASELRSDLARHLDARAFPATRANLQRTLRAHQAGQQLLDLVSALPADARFASLAELLPALGLPVAARPTSSESP